MVVYIAVLLPIALVSVHNLITFAAVMKSISRQRPGVVHPRRKHYSIIVQRCRQSFSLSCLLGLTWVFGFFAVGNASMVFQWLFCIFNSLQGVFIFIYFCLYQPDIKACILVKFNPKRSTASRTRSDIVRTVTTELAPQGTPNLAS